jgi:geranylgeranyl transferase type-2 subunit beta
MAHIVYLMLRLAEGTGNLPEETRLRQGDYLLQAQREDGGFAGRRGSSDAYYTSFALRALAMLGRLDERPARRAADYLKSRLAVEAQNANKAIATIDFLSLVMSGFVLEAAAGIDVFVEMGLDRTQATVDMLDKTRRDDGGFAKTAQGSQSSTYHTFLALVCFEMLGVELGDKARMIEMLRSRRRADGGFVELAVMEQSGTNPTAAALGALRILGAIDEPIRASAAAYLAGMITAEGGLRANSRIPAADLLSTFTGLTALKDLNAADTIDLEKMKRFALTLEQPQGGFLAGNWDNVVDVEYCFYGLGTLAWLSAG